MSAVSSFGEVCKDYYQGEKGRSMMCPIYCCGNEHSKYCCNDKSQRFSKDDIPGIVFIVLVYPYTTGNTVLWKYSYLTIRETLDLKLKLKIAKYYCIFTILLIRLSREIFYPRILHKMSVRGNSKV